MPNNLEVLLVRTKRYEGKRTNTNGRHILYKCPANRWTLGYGRNVEDRGISEVEAEGFLTRDVLEAQQDAASLFPSWLTLNDARRNVLTDMSYNMGRSKLVKFHDLIAAVECQDWIMAKAAIIDSAYYTQVGQRARDNADEMLTGVAL